MTFLVDPASISFDEVKADLVTYINTRPDAAKWKDFFASGTGETLVELIAGIGSLLLYDITAARRESFIQYSTIRSSAIAGSQTLGYSSYRGRNPVLNLTFTSDTTVSLSRFDLIGNIKDRDIILNEDVILNAGVQTTVSVIIGNLFEDQAIAQSDAPASFRFTTNKVSSDVRVFLRGTLVETSERILDLINEKFVLMSNVLGSVDVMYINLSTFAIRYKTGDIIKIQWIELKDTVVVASDIQLDYGTYVSYEYASTFQDAENIESIKINAPLFHETQYTVRGRSDYMKEFKLLDSTITSVNYMDVSPAVVKLTYLKNDLSSFIQADKDYFIYKLLSFRPMGLEPPSIQDPSPLFIKLTIDIKQKTAVIDPLEQVAGVIDQLARSLQMVIDLDSVENELEALSFTKIARVSLGYSVRANSTKYRNGVCLEPAVPNGFIYINKGRIFKSGAFEPTWPTTSGLTVLDGSYIWKTQNLLAGSFPTWDPETTYSIGTIVRSIDHLTPPFDNLSYTLQAINTVSGDDIAAVKATRLYNGVTFTSVNFGAVGNSIQLVFNGARTIFQVVSTWNLAVPSNQVTHDGVDNDILPAATFNLQNGIDYVSGEPIWPVTAVTLDSPNFVNDNNLLWIKANKKGTPATWATNTVYNIGAAVVPRVITPENTNLMYQCVGYLGATAPTPPVFPLNNGDTIIDGEIELQCLTSTSNLPTIAYNEYYMIETEVTIA